MTSLLASRLAALVSALLFSAALFYLQIVDAPKELVYGLPAYGVIAAATLIAVVAASSRFAFSKLCLAASAAFVGYIVLRALTSPSPYHARADLYCVLACLAVYAAVLIGFPKPRARIYIFGILLAAAVVHVAVGVVQAGWGENYSLLIPSLEDVEASERGTGLYVNPDHLAGLLEVLGLFGLSIACWSRLPGWVKVCFGYLTGLCYFGILLTGSRGGYLSALFGLFVFGLLSVLALRATGPATLRKFGGGGLLLLAAAMTASWFFIQESAPLKMRVSKLMVDEGRLDLWQAAIAQWKLQPIIGTGSGTYLFYGREFRSERMVMDPVDVHNDYLHLLAEYGLLGGTAFLFFLGAHLRQGWRNFHVSGPQRFEAGASPLSDRLALNIAALAALASYAAHSIVDFNLHIPANALLLALVFAIVATDETQTKGAEAGRAFTQHLRLLTGVLAVILGLQCARLIPGHHYTEKARVALRDEDPASALSFAQTALRYDRQNPRTHFYIGRALIAIARTPERSAERNELFDQALAAFDGARGIVPLDGTYPLEMAFNYDRLGRYEEAEAMYALARRRDPRSAQVASLYADHLQGWEKSRQEKLNPLIQAPSPSPE